MSEYHIAMAAYRAHVGAIFPGLLPDAGSEAGLVELAKKLAAPAIEAEMGWRTEPPFPGSHERAEHMPNGWRMLCACKWYKGDEELGVIFITLYSGKTTSVYITSPGTPIPGEYLPILSR